MVLLGAELQELVVGLSARPAEHLLVLGQLFDAIAFLGRRLRGCHL